VAGRNAPGNIIKVSPRSPRHPRPPTPIRRIAILPAIKPSPRSRVFIHMEQQRHIQEAL
jgi:hypothetical protein